MNDSQTISGFLHRVALTSRRQKIAFVALLLLLPASLATFEMFSPGSLLRSRSVLASAFAKEPSELLVALGLRSPGQRSKGELADTKQHSRRQAAVSRPHERALAKVRQPSNHSLPFAPAASQVAEGFPPVFPFGLPDIAGGVLPDIGSSIPGAPAFLIDVPGLGGGGGVGGGGIGGGAGGGGIGGGGGGTGGGVTPPGPPPVVSPVPEPATWSLMMMGFASIGLSLRRKRRRNRRVLGTPQATATGQ
jgi:hypothetical protein